VNRTPIAKSSWKFEISILMFGQSYIIVSELSQCRYPSNEGMEDLIKGENGRRISLSIPQYALPREEVDVTSTTCAIISCFFHKIDQLTCCRSERKLIFLNFDLLVQICGENQTI
jgi:hypothetical protein